MKQIFVPLLSIVLAGAVFSPIALAKDNPQPTDSSSQPASLLAAAAASFDSVELDKIKDSVLRIGVEFTGTFTIPPWTVDDAGNFVSSEDPSDATSISVTAYKVGSGFVVDPSGYIVTNAHVVDTSDATIVDSLWGEYSGEILDQYKHSDRAYDFLDYVGMNGTWRDVTYYIVVFNPAKTDAVGDIQELFKDGWSADTKKIGQPYPQIGKDIAVIKIQSDKPFVPVTLGDSSSIVAGSSVYVIGYPTIGDLSDKSFLVPTVTSGIVSALKPSDLGDYKVVQIDAAIAGGNSGGPVLNNKGQVVGIATFGATQSQGYNWALPVELAREYLRELNVTQKTVTNVNAFGFINNISVTIWAALAIFFFFTTCVLLVITVLVKRKSPAIIPAPVAASLAPNPFPPPPAINPPAPGPSSTI